MLSLDGGSTRTLDRPAVGPATSAKPPKPPGPSTSGNVRQAGAALIGLGLLGALLLVALLGALLVNGLAKGDRVGTPAQVPVAELDAPTPAPTEGADDPGPGGEEIEVPRAEDPPPVAPSATPASPPGGGVPDEDVPEAPARSKPAEGASVATEPLEEPGVLEDGAVDDAADGVVAVVPITNEEALPEVAVPAAPVPVLDSALLVGAWRGEADGRPIELRITAIDGTALRGELTFYQGPTARTLPAAGSVDALTGAVFVESGAFLLRGKATDASMSGTYKAGKRTAPWSLARSR